MNITYIRQLMRQNQLDMAIQALQRELAGKSEENMMETLAGEYNDLQEKELMNTMSATDLQISKNSFLSRLFKLVENIECKYQITTPNSATKKGQEGVTRHGQRIINQQGKNSVYIEKNDGTIHFE